MAYMISTSSFFNKIGRLGWTWSSETVQLGNFEGVLRPDRLHVDVNLKKCCKAEYNPMYLTTPRK